MYSIDANKSERIRFALECRFLLNVLLNSIFETLCIASSQQSDNATLAFPNIFTLSWIFYMEPRTDIIQAIWRWANQKTRVGCFGWIILNTGNLHAVFCSYKSSRVFLLSFLIATRRLFSIQKPSTWETLKSKSSQRAIVSGPLG